MSLAGRCCLSLSIILSTTDVSTADGCETYMYMKTLFPNQVEILWEKETLLVLSNFIFCHIVFNCRPLQRRQQAFVCGKGLKP